MSVSDGLKNQSYRKEMVNMTLVYTLSKHYDTIPLTDTQTLADAAHLTHDTLLKHIKNHPEDFGLLGRVRLSSRELRDLSGEAYYRLNEAQAMTIFGYLRNTDANRELEMELQHQFGEAKFELYLRRQRRDKCNVARQEVIDLARSNGLSTWEDGKCCDLAFQLAFDMSMSQYRSDNGICGGQRTVDYMPVADLDALAKAHGEIAAMLRDGNTTYEQIEAQVMKRTADNDNTPERKAGNPFWNFIAKKFCPFWPCDKCKQDDSAA